VKLIESAVKLSNASVKLAVRSVKRFDRRARLPIRFAKPHEASAGVPAASASLRE
jgi:hypothetical protein